jgi:uncharacterized membrane protein YeaQ/YmgE (transglycosylase-associated protein family)
MAIIGFLIVGLIAGAIARLIVPGRDPMGWLGTMALGCVGALVAGLVVGALGGTGVGLIGAILGAVVLLLLWRAFARDRGGVHV